MRLQVARIVGALAMLATGAVHLQQYLVQDFEGIPTIQLLFLLNVIGSGLVGVGLLAPIERVLGDRWQEFGVGVLAAVGLTIAIGSLVGLFISENEALFGLRTTRYSAPAVLAIVSEAAAVVCLMRLLVSVFRHRGALARQPG